MGVSIGRVVSIDDPNDGWRIKARVLPADQYKTDNNIDYAFPLLPKIFHVLPKVGEAVLILTADDDLRGQRYYLGPVTSQPQTLNMSDYMLDATSLLKGGVKAPYKSLVNAPDTKGSYPEDDEIGVLGRLNSDIIISDNDVRLRSGARVVNGIKDIKFNHANPAFVKLRYYPTGLISSGETVDSSVVVAAQDINLISTAGDPLFDLYDREEGVSEDTMKEILSKAHRLPYGDVLVDFLTMFLRMFYSHTHKYHNLPPCPDSESSKFRTKYPLNSFGEKILSKHVRIN